MSPELQIRIFAPLIVVAAFFALSFGAARSLRNPLSVIQKRMLAFGTIALLGVGYLILWQRKIVSATHTEAIWVGGLTIWILLSWVIASRLKFTDSESQG